jgi:hypothetical protein
VTEVLDSDVWSRLEASGYSSLLADGKRRFILFGPVALVMDGRDDVWFGPVLNYIQWEDYDPATRAFGRGERGEGVRQILLGGIPKSGEVRKKPRSEFGAGEEIVVPYSGMRKVMAVLTAELDRGDVEMAVAGELGRLGIAGTSAAAPGGSAAGKESGRGKERSKTPLTDVMVPPTRTKTSFDKRVNASLKSEPDPSSSAVTESEFRALRATSGSPDAAVLYTDSDSNAFEDFHD